MSFGQDIDDRIYVAMNMHWEAHMFELPRLTFQRWHMFADTRWESPDDICAPGAERPLRSQRHLNVAARSVVILVGK